VTVLPSPDDFMAAAAGGPSSTQGNTPWAAAYARELADVVTRYSDRRPRTLQRHLGPSELGVACDRQVVGKLLGLPKTNHVADPWPSYVGTAVHAELEQTFQWADLEDRPPLPPQTNAHVDPAPFRWHTERRVTPRAGNEGTADLYDAATFTLGDHKCLGDTTMKKVRSAGGPPRKYVAQMALYAVGYMRLGLRVDRTALIAWPRTGSSLDGLYVHEQAMDASMFALVKEVFADTDRRELMADYVAAGNARIEDVTRAPDGDECHFCPFYRPQSARDGGVGCPGTVA
jgi:hypothetical protein